MDSFIPYTGGKKLLRKKITERFPEKINRYVEVFGGAAWVLFYKEKYAAQEVYNDINGELVNLFRMVKYHPSALQEELNWLLNARQIFDVFKTHQGLTEIQRAAKLYYLLRTSFGAKMSDYSGNYRDCASFLKGVGNIKERLSKVVIENRDFTDILKQYDKEGTLFYCDPPYYEAEKYYKIEGYSFGKEQHILLKNILANIKGKFILSYNNHDFIKKLYQGFPMEEVERCNNIGNALGKEKKYQELIIRNYN